MKTSLNDSKNLPLSCEVNMGLYDPQDPECQKCQRAAKEICMFYAYISQQKTKTEIINNPHVVEFEEQ